MSKRQRGGSEQVPKLCGRSKNTQTLNANRPLAQYEHWGGYRMCGQSSGQPSGIISDLQQHLDARDAVSSFSQSSDLNFQVQNTDALTVRRACKEARNRQ